jgi:hypothetical protein
MSNPQNQDFFTNNEQVNTSFSIAPLEPNLITTDSALFVDSKNIDETPSSTALNDINPPLDVNSKAHTPIVVSPLSSSTSSQYIQNVTPLNPDKNSITQINAPETYTLANYKSSYDNENHPKISQVDDEPLIAQDDLLDEINLENAELSNDIAYLNEKDSLKPISDVEKQITQLIHSNTITTGVDTENLNNKIVIEKKIDSNDKSLTSFKKQKPRKSTANVLQKRPAFVIKLWKMINDSSNSQYISWMKNGKAFQVNDRENFMKYVLPKYFKHNNFASFVRQLNMYGWHKIQDVTSGSLTNPDEIWQFENPNFIKDREDLLDNIVRNKPTKDNEDEDVDIKHLLEQLEQMKRNQLLISEDLRRVRQDNEMLWKDNFIARERHKIQSETLEKIMRFLASIYGNNTSKLLEQMNNPNATEFVEFNGPYGPVKSAHTDNYYSPLNTNNANNNNNDLAMQIQRYAGLNMIQHQNYPQHRHNHPHYQHQNQRLNHNLYHQSSQQQIDQPAFAGGINNYDHHPFQHPTHYYSQQNGTYPPQNYSKRQLLITNRSDGRLSSTSISKSNNSSNEVRMTNLGYEPTASETADSSIQEIRRGPENRNSESHKHYIQQIPDYINTPRQFSEPSNSSTQSFNNFPAPALTDDNNRIQYSSSPAVPTPILPIGTNAQSNKNNTNDNNKTKTSESKFPEQYVQYDDLPQISPLTQIQPTSSISQLPPSQAITQGQLPQNISQPSDEKNTVTFPIFPSIPSNSANASLMKNGAGESNPSTDSAQLMGNIHQQLHKNQGALKQVNDWLNKYNDTLDSDMPLADNFEVEDFLQQPLDISIAPTPIDFNNLDNFISADTPIQTPVLSTPQLNVPVTGLTPLNGNHTPEVVSSASLNQLDSKKRDSTNLDLNDSVINSNITNDGNNVNTVSNKRFKPSQF